MKKFLIALFVVFATVPLFAACSSKNTLVAVTEIKFYESEIELGVGESVALQYKIFPANATNQNVQFSSSDPSAVSVTEDGVVTLNRSQSAYITVRSTDGTSTKFSARCKIVPITPPEDISYDKTLFEEKYIDGEVKDCFMLSVGQTKVVPTIIFPEGASASRISVSSNSDTVVVKKGAEWMLFGKKQGSAHIVVSNTLSDASCEFDVIVEKPVANIEMFKTNGNDLIDISVDKINENYYEASVDFVSDEVSYLGISFKTAQNSVGLSELVKNVKALVSVSDATVFDYVLIDSYEDYTSHIDALEMGGVDNFNSKKYIQITPHENASSELYILSNAVAQNGKPITIKINILVSDRPDGVFVTADLSHASAENSVAIVGEYFSLNIMPYANIAGSEDQKPIPLGKRRVYFSVGNTDAVRPIDRTNALSEINEFLACGVSDSVTITVYVSKENSSNELLSPSIEDLDLSEIDEYYVKGFVTISVQKQPIGVYMEYGGNVLKNGDSIAVETGDIEINLGVVCADTTICTDAIWDFEISSDSVAVSVDENGALHANAAGQSTITIKCFDGTQYFTKIITIIVED